MRCQHKQCNGTIILEKGYGPNPDRLVCLSCGREPKRESPGNNDKETIMSNNLKPEKEEEVKTLLKTHSIREIVRKTGVSKNTIARIKNENFTDEEKKEMKTQSMVRAKNKGESEKVFVPKMKLCLKCKKEKSVDDFTINSATKDGLHNHCRECKNAADRERRGSKLNQPNIPEKGLVVQKIEVLESQNSEIGKFGIFKIPENLTFADIASKYFEYCENRQEEIYKEIKSLAKEYMILGSNITDLDQFLCGDANAKKLSRDDAFKEFIETESDILAGENTEIPPQR